MKVIETDNFDGDYPDEKVIMAGLSEEHAKAIAEAINDGFPEDWPRYYKVVKDDYKLQPGFEP